MCGICGVAQIGGDPRPVLTSEALDRMTDIVAHRGPDDRGTYMQPGIALGVRRLSVIDIAGGHQPLCDERARVWAVQNGEIYNYRTLRDELVAAGHTFSTACDTEVIPHLYEASGVAFPRRLRGMFAVAVWDVERRRLVLARDHFGIKPLYYSRVGDLLIFGSELKSVLASGLVPTDLDYEAVDAYLRFGFFPAPRTPLAAVSKLLPGWSLTVDGGETQLERFWDLPTASGTAAVADEAEAAERLLAELEESVRLQLVADVPLGAMLSGGLDSSLIVALMARMTDRPVKTFSVGFKDQPGGNELADARVVAEAFGTDHHELELTTSEPLDLADLAWHMDEPLADLSALGFGALCRLATQHVTVALSGQGADELLGGYRHHRTAAMADSADRVPRGVAAGIAGATRALPGRYGRAGALVAKRHGSERWLALRTQCDDALHARLVRGPLADLPSRAGERVVQPRLDEAPRGTLAAVLRLDTQVHLPDDMLLYFDRASMACSLEMRVPFLDPRVAEVCASIPGALKASRRHGTKYILRVVGKSLLPESVILKPKVGFFNSAVDSWLRSQARSVVQAYLCAESPRFADMIDPAAVRALVRLQRDNGDPRAGPTILSLLFLEIWLQEYLPRATKG